MLWRTSVLYSLWLILCLERRVKVSKQLLDSWSNSPHRRPKWWGCSLSTDWLLKASHKKKAFSSLFHKLAKKKHDYAFLPVSFLLRAWGRLCCCGRIDFCVLFCFTAGGWNLIQGGLFVHQTLRFAGIIMLCANTALQIIVTTNRES